MRNESTNHRLLALEKQMKILSSSKSCDESTGSPSNYDRTVVLIGTTANPLENRPDFHKGENCIGVIQFSFFNFITKGTSKKRFWGNFLI